MSSSFPFRNASTEPRPFLITRGPGLAHRRSLVEWWHLLSLDAPTVAALWTLFVAWSAGVGISVADAFAMFMAVWTLYATDRLLDARPLHFNEHFPGLEERHRFHHVHRGRFLGCILAASVSLAWLLHRLHEGELRLYILLGCLLAGWLIVVHARPAAASATAHALPKELAVGVFFPAAVFVPTVARAPELRTALLPGALAFASVCTLNCLFLAAWEHALDRDYGHVTTRWCIQHLRQLTWTVVLMSAALACAGIVLPGLELTRSAPLALCCCLSAILLLALHQVRHALSCTTRRAFADLALLTPVIPFCVAALKHLHG